MKILISVLSLLYSQLLRLYPRHFREQFADEMQGVFEQVLNDSGAVPIMFWLVVIREFGVLPASLLREHWREWTRATGGLASLTEDERPSPWPEALFTALPFGLLLITYVVRLGPFTVLLVIGLTILALLIAWRKNWPRWSAGWLALMLFVLVSYSSSFIYMFANDWNTPQTLAAHLIGEVLLPVVLGAGLYAVYQRDTLKGMLIVLFLLEFMNPFALEFVPDPIRTLTTAGTQVIVVLTAIWLARRGRRMTGVGLLIGAAVLIGLALSITSEYGNSFTNTNAPEAVEVVRSFLPNLLDSLALLIGPLLLRTVWEIARRSNRLGIFGHRLAWLGLILMLIAEFGSYRLFLPDDLSAFRSSVGGWFMVAVWVGVVLYLSGLGLTALAARRAGVSLSLPLYGLLAMLLFASPLIAQSSRIMATRSLPIILPNGSSLTSFHQLSDLWVLVIGASAGLLWLIFSTGLIALLNQRPQNTSLTTEP